MDMLKRVVKSDWLLPVFCFCMYFTWSIWIPLGGAPDEPMRLKIPFFIFNNGYLPLGSEEAVRDSLWGISYGFAPYGSSLVAIPFMWLVSLVNTSQAALTIAARFTSVLFSSLTVFVCLKIGPLVFRHDSTKYLLAIFVGFLPQFVFLSSYFNCDTMSILAAALIVYCWLIGIERGWTTKRCIALGAAIGMCALSYYYAYGFILLSIPVFIISYVQQMKVGLVPRGVILAKQVLVVFIVAFAIAGWFFVRLGILYDGDFLGLSAQNDCAEIYAIDSLKPSNIITAQDKGYSVFGMITGINTPYYAWLLYTAITFLAAFGPGATTLAPLWVYKIYIALFVLFLIIGIIHAFTGHSQDSIVKLWGSDKGVLQQKWFVALLVLAVFIPWGLSVYYSYAVDYQAQGRYIMSGLVLIMLFISFGVEAVQDMLVARSQRGLQILEKAIPICVVVVYLALFVYLIVTLAVPNAVYIFN